MIPLFQRDADERISPSQPHAQAVPSPQFLSHSSGSAYTVLVKSLPQRQTPSHSKPVTVGDWGYLLVHL